MAKDNINPNRYKASEKRSEEIAVFDKLNDLLNEQEKEFLKDRNLNCVVVDGAEVPEELVKDVINRLGDLGYGKN